MKRFHTLTEKAFGVWGAVFIIIIFFASYLTLAFGKHHSFQTGFDLAFANQAVYKYSHLTEPVITLHSYYDSSILQDHVEIIYILLAPLYRIFPSAYLLLFLQCLAICVSGYAVYMIAKKYVLAPVLCLSILVSYLSFYGIQFALWSDVHSLVFAVSFLAFFLYFLEAKRWRWSTLFFLLSILCKEDIALFTLGISFVQYMRTRDRVLLGYIGASVFYLLFLFTVYYPHFTRDGYRYASEGGLLSKLDPRLMVNSPDKQQTYLYSLLHYGFLPIFSPLALIPSLLDLAHYYLPGGEKVAAAQGIFLHYRSTLSLLLVWPTIMTLSKLKKYNVYLLSGYILFFALLSQYILHLPLSYLSKSWFWQAPSHSNIESAIELIPPESGIATQVNILPHVSNRDIVYTLFPETMQTDDPDLCGRDTCYTLRFAGEPEYILVDTSAEWNALHLLANNHEFVEGIKTLERLGKITPYKVIGTTVIYKVK